LIENDCSIISLFTYVHKIFIKFIKEGGGTMGQRKGSNEVQGGFTRGSKEWVQGRGPRRVYEGVQGGPRGSKGTTQWTHVPL
jgi:hypothetical protein